VVLDAVVDAVVDAAVDVEVDMENGPKFRQKSMTLTEL